MRCPSSAVLAILAACAGSSVGAPVDLMNPGAVQMLRRIDRYVAAPDALPVCDRAADAAAFRELCGRVGGEVAALGPGHVRFGAEQAVVVVVAGEPRLERVEIATEEGVDVVTLVVGAGELASGWQRTAFVLRLDRRPCQLAIALRHERGEWERTAGVFEGL